MKRMRIFLVGPSGSGKTVIGHCIGQSLGITHSDTDSLIAEREGVINVSQIFNEQGESYFREREIELLRTISGADQPVIVSTGGGLPAINGAMPLMLSTGYVIYLRARPKTLWHRLEVGDELRLRPLLWNKGIAELRRLCRLRRRFYSLASYTIDTDGLKVAQSAELALKAIKRQRL